MTVVTIPLLPRKSWIEAVSHAAIRTYGRLLRLELRRSAMLWMVPVVVALFWFGTYRSVMGTPPFWGVRTMTMQETDLANFTPFIVGAAAWMGSREGRRKITDLVTCTAWSGWARQLAAWVGAACWAMAAYVGCVGVVYLVTARQGAWGGPLWWPAVVGVVGVLALCALGFTAGVLLPSRFTPPLAAIVAFILLTGSLVRGERHRTFGLISPQSIGYVQGNTSVGTLYPYLPDLAIAQVMFLVGLGVAALAVLGLAGASGASVASVASGARWLRVAAVALTAAGLGAVGTAVALIGTARLDAHGMMTIPALHDAASDRPIRYTPVCGPGAIAVCLSPAYRAYLPAMTTALEPLLSEVAGLPGAPISVSQAAPAFQMQPGGGVFLGIQDSDPQAGDPRNIRLLLEGFLPSSGGIDASFIASAQQTAAPAIVSSVAPGNGPAEQAVQAALLMAARIPLVSVGQAQAGPPGSGPPGSGPPGSGPPGSGVPGPASGTPVYEAAARFAALPGAARHAWLAAHLTALRAGHITLEQIP